ncbi:MAG: hypothetical protein QXR65_01260 [Candidatus Bathyarchaeia archaeon]|nr:hypothetical protein [Candidatus Bathyarchaeota archaeon]
MRVKTSFVIDEKVWTDFKTITLNRYGTKKLSSAVEEALKAFNVLSMIEELAGKLDLEIFYLSSRELKEKRPTVRASAGATIREMRDERETHLLRFQRDS